MHIAYISIHFSCSLFFSNIFDHLFFLQTYRLKSKRKFRNHFFPYPSFFNFIKLNISVHIFHQSLFFFFSLPIFSIPFTQLYTPTLYTCIFWSLPSFFHSLTVSHLFFSTITAFIYKNISQSLPNKKWKIFPYFYFFLPFLLQIINIFFFFFFFKKNFQLNHFFPTLPPLSMRYFFCLFFLRKKVIKKVGRNTLTWEVFNLFIHSFIH